MGAGCFVRGGCSWDNPRPHGSGQTHPTPIHPNSTKHLCVQMDSILVRSHTPGAGQEKVSLARSQPAGPAPVTDSCTHAYYATSLHPTIFPAQSLSFQSEFTLPQGIHLSTIARSRSHSRSLSLSSSDHCPSPLPSTLPIWQNLTLLIISLVIAFIRGWMLTLLCLSTFPLMIAAQYFQFQFIAGIGGESSKVPTHLFDPAGWWYRADMYQIALPAMDCVDNSASCQGILSRI